MVEKRRKVLVPQYMSIFKCIACSCEDSCCSQWKVNIDRETYNKYKNISDVELKSMFDKYLIQEEDPTEQFYAQVKLIRDNRCPFLNEEKLCLIQLKKGEEYLSRVCSAYPRYTNIVDDTLEKSAKPSCPEVARIALLNPEGIEFDHVEEDDKIRNLIQMRINTNDKANENKPQKFFWELRIFSIGLLQNRNYELWERLIILGLFYQKLQEYIESCRIEEIPILLQSYTDKIENGAFKESLVSIPTHYDIQMELLNSVIELGIMRKISSQRYADCLNELFAGLEYLENDRHNMSDILGNYIKAYNNYYLPFMSKHEYILENDLANYVFVNLFPFGNTGNVFEEYIFMIIHYALIKIHLTGMGAFHKGLSIELVLKLIQSITKAFEHDRGYRTELYKTLKSKGYAKMAYMAILIKN